MEDVLAESVNPDMIVINLLDELGDAVRAEEIVEGMEHEHDHDHDDDDHEGEDSDHESHDEAEHEGEGHDGEEHDHDSEGEEPELDEHVWLSLRNAQQLANVIASRLAELDPDGAETYAANAARYTAELAALDARYSETVSGAAYDTLLFGDRFPFRYMVDDYGLKYYAAFAGCSAETEASFETIVFLSQKLQELDLPAVLTIEGPNHKIAETIINATSAQDQLLLTLDSMQGTTLADAQAGESYLSIMERNLEVLVQALN